MMWESKTLGAAIITLETDAMASLFFNVGPQTKFILFFLGHIPASICAGIILWRLMPERFQKPRVGIIALLSAFCIFVPIIGFISLLFATVILMGMKQSVEELNVQFIAPPILTPSNVRKNSQFGIGGAYSRIVNDQMPLQSRVDAVLAISKQETPGNTMLLRRCLLADADQLRLLAYTLLDKQETQLSNTINTLLQEVKDKTSLESQAELHKQLALAYWELIYRNFVQAELKQQTLKLVKQHSRIAKAGLPEDTNLVLLDARIAFNEKNYQHAMQHFQRAGQLGAPYSKTIPYIAEIYFKQADTKKLSALLKQYPNLRDVPHFGPVMQYWEGSA